MKKLIKLQVLSICLVASIQSFATEVEIFTDTAHPVMLDAEGDGVQVHYYNLDVGMNALSLVQQQLQKGVANVDINTAKQVIISQQANLQQLQGNFLVAQYGLNQYPAIVFDQKAVVYGYTSLGAALKEYQTWQASNS